MIAEYKNAFFNIREENNRLRIWCFNPIAGFSSRISRGGNCLYEKFVDKSEIDRVFDVGFATKWNGLPFWGWPTINHSVYLRTENEKEAQEFGFDADIEDRGEVILWYKIVDIDSCEEFKVIFTDCFSKEKEERLVSKTEWQELHHKLVDELMPPR